MPAFASCSIDARVSDVLPPPDGAETMKSPPGARAIRTISEVFIRLSSLLDILHLLAQLLDDDLDLDGVARDLGVLRLRSQRVRLAVQLLHQEVQPPADRVLAPQRL